MNKLPPTGTIEIAPSILSADFANLAQHIATIENEVKILHIDIMDGHFVPNITFGPLVLKNIRPHSKLFFDTHLMISDPAKYAPDFVNAGADGITFHLEAVTNPRDMIKILRDLNVSVGISIKPKTPVSDLEPVIEFVDMVLLMSVEPGFGGQSFIPNSPPRCEELKKLLLFHQRLEVDGGIDATTVPIITRAGADTIVAGSAVFGKDNPAQQVRNILNAAKS